MIHICSYGQVIMYHYRLPLRRQRTKLSYFSVLLASWYSIDWIYCFLSQGSSRKIEKERLCFVSVAVSWIDQVQVFKTFACFISLRLPRLPSLWLLYLKFLKSFWKVFFTFYVTISVNNLFNNLACLVQSHAISWMGEGSVGSVGRVSESFKVNILIFYKPWVRICMSGAMATSSVMFRAETPKALAKQNLQ